VQRDVDVGQQQAFAAAQGEIPEGDHGQTRDLRGPAIVTDPGRHGAMEFRGALPLLRVVARKEIQDAATGSRQNPRSSPRITRHPTCRT
jgi:hypothetical protein